jgi:hypothetical protein
MEQVLVSGSKDKQLKFWSISTVFTNESNELERSNLALNNENELINES